MLEKVYDSQLKAKGFCRGAHVLETINGRQLVETHLKYTIHLSYAFPSSVGCEWNSLSTEVLIG